MEQRSDSDIRADITEHLRSAGLPLTVSVEEGTLRLEGIVTSEDERQAALDLAGWVPGVVETIDDMELLELEIDSPNAFFQTVSTIEEPEGVTNDPMLAASEGLAYFPPTDPPVRLNDESGELEIASGFMSTSLDDDEVESEDGGGKAIGSEDLADRVRRNLREDARTSALKLYVSVLSGAVVLTGFVHDNLDRELAMAVADETPGVDEVVDRIVLGAAPSTQPEERSVSQQSQMAHVVTPNSTWRATVIANRFVLRAKREEVEERLRHAERDLRSYGVDQAQEGGGYSHDANVASDMASATELSAKIEFEQQELTQIDEALERMDNGTYGICVDTGQLIYAARLRANPLAIRTIEAQRRYEARMEL